MNNKKLKNALEYCLANLKHPETPQFTQYYGQTYVDGYTIPQLPTSEQIITNAKKALELAELRAAKIKQFEQTLESIKEILEEL